MNVRQQPLVATRRFETQAKCWMSRLEHQQHKATLELDREIEESGSESGHVKVECVHQ